MIYNAAIRLKNTGKYLQDYIICLRKYRFAALVTCVPDGGFGAANTCLRPAGTLLDLDLEEQADLI